MGNFMIKIRSISRVTQCVQLSCIEFNICYQQKNMQLYLILGLKIKKVPRALEIDQSK